MGLRITVAGNLDGSLTRLKTRRAPFGVRGGPRTYHRLAVGVEDAGFEIRDQLQWIFGSGFPKSLDISKAIDKAAGAERDIITEKQGPRPGNHGGSGEYGHGENRSITAPSTPETIQWDGWGTALKPANEPIVLARKPLSEKTVAANVLKWGTGGLNIDAGRIEFQSEADKASSVPGGKVTTKKPSDGFGKAAGKYGTERIELEKRIPTGRFPANLILDETAAAMLDAQVGLSVSRFFYVAKASKRIRNDGTSAKAVNAHPTVKPIKLMTYLCRLITPPGGVVLDPFMGSGSTGIAALIEGFKFIGMEREKEYYEIASSRIKSQFKTLKRLKAKKK